MKMPYKESPTGTPYNDRRPALRPPGQKRKPTGLPLSLLNISQSPPRPRTPSPGRTGPAQPQPPGPRRSGTTPAHCRRISGPEPHQQPPPDIRPNPGEAARPDLRPAAQAQKLHPRPQPTADTTRTSSGDAAPAPEARTACNPTFYQDRTSSGPDLHQYVHC